MRLAKPWRRWLVLASLPIIVAAFAVWLVGSESGLRFLARQASNGTLSIQGLHGTLVGPLRIESITLNTETKRFELHGLDIDWSPQALRQRELRISRLELDELRITELKPSTEPLSLPDSLHLPVSVSVPVARLDRLVLNTSTQQLALSRIEFKLEKPEQTYRLELQSLTSPWGSAQAQASLADAAPYALTGQASFRHDKDMITASLAGTLDRINLKALAVLAGGRADADLLVTPFASRPLERAHIHATAIDPALYDKTLPKADLDLSAELTSQGEEDYEGSLTLRNRQPDAWDKGRLPIRELSSHFKGTVAGMDLPDLHLDLARAGQANGSGRIEPDRLSLDLQVRGLDPNALYGRLRSLHLNGELHLQADAGRQHLLADLGDGRYQLSLDAEYRAKVLRISKALLSSGGGLLSLHGSVGLEQDQPFDLAGSLSHFDPAAFGSYPAAEVNATFNSTGRLSPKPTGQLAFAIKDSRFRHRPLTGQGKLRLSAQRLWDSDIRLGLGSNQLMLHGAFGEPGDQLALQLKGDQLGIIDPALSGRIEASGTLTGGFATPAGQLDIQADKLAWGTQYRVDSLLGKASLEPGSQGKMALNAVLSGLRTPQFQLTQSSARIEGRRNQHTIKLTAQNPDLDLSAELAGAWRDINGKPDWTGQIQHLTNLGHYPVNLLSPARLHIQANSLRIEQARFASLGAVVNIQEAAYQTGHLHSRGTFSGLSANTLHKWPGWPEQLNGELKLGGTWQIDAGERINGQLTVSRQTGDLVFSSSGQPATPLGLKMLNLALDAKDNLLSASLEINGTNLGRLQAKGESRLSRRSGNWGFAGDTPLRGQLDLALQSLAWAAPFMDRSGAVLFDGSLSARLQADGTIAAPRLDGTITGQRISLAIPGQGTSFKNGSFQASLHQDSLELNSLRLSGGSGTLTGNGKLMLRGNAPDLQLAFQADKLEIISRPDRLLILSGDGKLALAGHQLSFGAKLKADRGLIQLAEDDTPTISDDVVVLGREKTVQTRTRPLVVDLNLDLDLGDRFFLKGHGVDAQLGGTIKISGRQDSRLSANGSIHVIKGSYAAYGQKLNIERGLLNFQGPLDNPGLNIQAMRNETDVQAGVAITGTAQAPVVKLVSTPALPDSEKLSWLVLGHGMSGSSGQEYDALQLAAKTLLGAGDSVSLQDRIAHATGLDEVSLKSSGTLDSSILSLGKRLSSRTYMSFEQGLTGAATLVRINHTLTRTLSLRTEAGTSQAVDLFYTFSFD